MSSVFKFRHFCANCKNEIEVDLDIQDRQIIYRRCHHCSHVHKYNNKNGEIANHVKQHLPKQNKFDDPLVKAKWKSIHDQKPTETPPKIRKKVLLNAMPSIKNLISKAIKKIYIPTFLPKKKIIYTALIFLLSIFLLFIFYILFVFTKTSISNNEYVHLPSSLQEIHSANIVYDINGIVISELIQSPRGNITPAGLPPELISILVFIEDKNFFDHRGLDYRAVFRAFLGNMVSLRFAQGASTITQQTARILLKRREKTIERKIIELKVANILEEKLDKKEILAIYANRVYLGHGAYGFQNASKFYFSKGLMDLNFAENLALACLPSSAETFSPLRNPKLLEKKMNHVYERMKNNGFRSPPKEEFNNQKRNMFFSFRLRSPSETVFGERVDNSPWASEMIRNFIARRISKDLVFDSGLKITTTLDHKLQIKAKETFEKIIPKIAKRHRPIIYKDGKFYKNARNENVYKQLVQTVEPFINIHGQEIPASNTFSLQASAVGVESATGEIRFIQGGSNFNANNQLNRAINMYRQTGSAIKPFIYATALENNAFHASSIVQDKPFYARTQTKRSFWIPENISGTYLGDIRLRDAFANSKNTPAIRVAQKTGMHALEKMFRKVFFYKKRSYTRFRKDDTIAIGTLEMSPMEMTLAFANFGNNGVVPAPHLIKKITDHNGNILYAYSKDQKQSFLFAKISSKRRKVFSGDTVHVMRSLLKDSGKVSASIGSQVIGKTGTSNDHRDMWFVGENQGVSATVWVGYDKPRYSLAGGTGASIAAPIWRNILQVASSQKIVSPYPRAVVKKICKLTGKRAGKNCPDQMNELFRKKNYPTETCQKHEQKKSHDYKIKKETNDFE